MLSSFTGQKYIRTRYYDFVGRSFSFPLNGGGKKCQLSGRWSSVISSSGRHHNIPMRIMIIFALLYKFQSCHANTPKHLSRPLIDTPHFKSSQRNLFLESIQKHGSVIDDAIDQDADADDDNHTEDLVENYLKSEDVSKNWTESPFTNYTKCSWYTLSHYITPDSILYDGIEGCLIALLVCLLLATCYSYSYYCCLTRCGCCPDDRINESLLNRTGREKKKVKRILNNQARGDGVFRCYFCFCSSASRDKDGKGAFMPLSRQNDSSDDDDAHSSVSLDSALSLEYGDSHLYNEYGEVTSRWDDEKIEAAARDYFGKEENETVANRKQKLGGLPKKIKKRRKKSHYPTTTCARKKRGGSVALSQASSILSSSSDNSFSYCESSSTGSCDALEMEAAMMDLELVKRSIAEKGYV